MADHVAKKEDKVTSPNTEAKATSPRKEKKEKKKGDDEKKKEGTSF